jgi:hypothetical protein
MARALRVRTVAAFSGVLEPCGLTGALAPLVTGACSAVSKNDEVGRGASRTTESHVACGGSSGCLLLPLCRSGPCTDGMRGGARTVQDSRDPSAPDAASASYGADAAPSPICPRHVAPGQPRTSALPASRFSSCSQRERASGFAAQFPAVCGTWPSVAPVWPGQGGARPRNDGHCLGRERGLWYETCWK